MRGCDAERKWAGWMRGLALVGVSWLMACGGGTALPEGVDRAEATQVSLMASDFAALAIPDSSREGGQAPAEWIAVQGPFKYAGTNSAGMHKWATDIPYRPRGLFFHNKQPGMELRSKGGEPLGYGHNGSSSVPYWSHNRRKLFIFTPEKGSGPEAGQYEMTYPLANEREAEMNFALSGLEAKEEFVRASIHVDWDTRSGLLLPAPGKASFEVTVPKAGRLLMSPGLVPPEVVDGALSDGASLVVRITDGTGATIDVHSQDLLLGKFDTVSVDLSKWSDQAVTLELETVPGGNATFDYAFVGEPTLASVVQEPRRVVMVFVDTLRPDHLGLYGYQRDTSPKLDAWAQDAVIFDNHRSVAPWTLPSARSAVTGRHPEFYAQSETLQRTLSDQGWSTAMFAGNVYLSTNFQMARDWGLHRVGMWPRAEVITDQALDWLKAHEGQDALVQVHYMDAHLPYIEPKQYRFMFAGDGQGGLREEFHLSDVRRINTRDSAVRQYIMDRYDNNVRYATDEVVRLLDALGPNDIVVFYSDHGEEFWDHGGFEHGHHLFDELLRVPFIVKAPGFEGRRVAEATSLLDLTPTVLDLVGLKPAQEVDGVSLVPAMEAGSDEALANRDLAFGRPLYGTERWGVLTRDQKKWTTNEGREALYDLTQDRAEKRNLIANKEGSHGEPYRATFGDALQSEVGIGYRLVGSQNRGGRPSVDMVAAMTVPGGVKAAWVEHDPLDRSYATVTVSPGPEEGVETVVATWHKGVGGQGIVWVIPNKPIEEVTHHLEIKAQMGDTTGGFTVDSRKNPGLGAYRTPLGMAQFPSRNVRLTLGISPIPREGMEGVRASDPEMAAMLEALGYAVGDEDMNKQPVMEKPSAAPKVNKPPAAPKVNKP